MGRYGPKRSDYDRERISKSYNWEDSQAGPGVWVPKKKENDKTRLGTESQKSNGPSKKYSAKGG